MSFRELLLCAGHGLSAATLALLVGCGGGGSSGSIKPSGKLLFSESPMYGTVGVVLNVEVEVRDSSGKLRTDAQEPITIELVTRNGKSKLLGDLTMKAVGGIARFTSLKIDRADPACILRASAQGLDVATSRSFVTWLPQNVILMIADGWGYKHVEATENYVGAPSVYASWERHPMSTWDLNTKAANNNVGYDPTRAWSDLVYLVGAATDSAASATAMYTGQKTDAMNVSVSAGDQSRLLTIGELLAARGISTGAVSSVPLNHATPGAWMAHNNQRWNYYAIADEGLFGYPNATGNPSKHGLYSGGWGATLPGPCVIIGGGHPQWSMGAYVNQDQLAELRYRSGNHSDGEWNLVERISGDTKAADRLMVAARDLETKRLCGLFGGASGNIELRGAKGLGHDPENPTLAEMTEAALTALERKPGGFALMVEGGAVDWASHSSDLDAAIGEMIGFDAAVKVVSDWVDDPNNSSSWENTLVIVTGDHECGMLTSGYLVLPDVPFGEISDRTLALEKYFKLAGNPSGLRASWEDTNGNDEIDVGSEKVYWVWHSPGHSNSLIPLYAKGVGSTAFEARAVGADPVRGRYIDNTDVFHVMRDVFR